MSKQVSLEQDKGRAENSTGVAVKTEDGSAACPMQGKSWIKGTLGMAICCGAPLLLLAAIAFFGLSLGAMASGALSLVAVLACPVGMFLMMRMMMKDKK
jgi:hypothetical protein